MNTQNEAEDKIKLDEEKLLGIQKAQAAIENKTSHEGFRDAKLLIDLTDEADCLDTTLEHERERQADNRK